VTVDDRPVAPRRRAYDEMLVPKIRLAAGTHEVRVVNGDGQFAVATFTSP
jgi:hypothetical protein